MSRSRPFRGHFPWRGPLWHKWRSKSSARSPCVERAEFTESRRQYSGLVNGRERPSKGQARVRRAGGSAKAPGGFPADGIAGGPDKSEHHRKSASVEDIAVCSLAVIEPVPCTAVVTQGATAPRARAGEARTLGSRREEQHRRGVHRLAEGCRARHQAVAPRHPGGARQDRARRRPHWRRRPAQRVGRRRRNPRPAQRRRAAPRDGP